MPVSVTGLSEAIAHLRAVRERASNLGPVLEVAAADTAALIDDAFATGTSPNGGRWDDLSDSTKASRRGVEPFMVLVDTGRLRGSVNARAEGQSLKFGTNTRYGIFHQVGSRVMPPRPFLPIDGEARGEFSIGRSGAAGAHWARVKAMVKRYIVTGEIV